MLPGSRSVYRWTMSMVTSPARKGDDHAAADPAGDPGPRRPGRAGTPLPHHPRRPDPHPPARRGVWVRGAPLGGLAQRPGPAGGGKKRLRVEALLGAAASSAPPPACDLVPDATLAADLFPEDLPRLLGLLGRADLYLQDEVEVALHPTLTRVWSRAGRSGQRRGPGPRAHPQPYRLPPGDT